MRIALLSRRVMAMLLCAVLLVSLMPTTLASEQTKAVTAQELELELPCQNSWEQLSTRWANPIRSNMVAEKDGTFTLVDAADSTVAVVRLAADGKVISRTDLEMELPLWGGYHRTENGWNVLVFGERNEQETDDCETYRTVLYNENWERMGDWRAFGVNTSLPFRAGSLRMDDRDGILLIATAREQYLTSDGLHHQLQINFAVDMNEWSGVGYSGSMEEQYFSGHVSHSFNQFVKWDGDSIYSVSHGDAYPRSVRLSYVSALGNNCKYYDALNIAGKIGDNATGVTIGGVELSEKNVLIVGSSVEQNPETYDTSSERHIFLSVVAKDLSGDRYIRLREPEDAVCKVGAPYMVSLGGDRFLILWQEKDVCMVVVNGEGEKLTDTITVDSCELGECPPILGAEGKVTWYKAHEVRRGEDKVTLYTVDITKLSNHSHNFQPMPDIAATCIAEGRTGGVACCICGIISVPPTYTPQISHDMAYEVVQRPTCTEDGRGRWYCINCNTRDAYFTLEKYGHFIYTEEGKEPTCTEPGYSVYEFCYRCNEVLQERQELPALGHDIEVIPGQKPTCLAGGTSDSEFCRRCQKTITPHAQLPALGHDWDEGEILVEPTKDEHGQKQYTCLRCAETKTVTAYLVDPADSFEDVKEDKYYYDGLAWALANEITNGTDATHFSPNKTCTRAQIVTFLWRAAGCPEAETTEHPFTDVVEGASYYPAMLWAVENGITDGTTPTTFAPRRECTRAQIVTFLWRALGCPEAENTAHQFTDVVEGASYYEAMLWAVENGITDGTTETTFSPRKACTRGQAVTFLFRSPLREQKPEV